MNLLSPAVVWLAVLGTALIVLALQLMGRIPWIAGSVLVVMVALGGAWLARRTPPPR